MIQPFTIREHLTMIYNILKNKKSCFETVKESKLPIILYGMGNGADKVINQLEKIDLKPSGVMASDDFVRGQYYRGYKVKKLSDIEKEFSEFIILVCFASQLEDVMENIKKVASKYKTLVPSISVFGDLICDCDFINKYNNNIEKARDLFEDKHSLKVFDNTLKFYFTGELNYLLDSYSDKQEVFSDIIKFRENEKYLDLGAYRGDTIEEFLKYMGSKKYSKIIALEPDEKTFRKLSLYAKKLNNIELYQYGIWNKPDILMFENKGGRNSSIDKNININKKSKAIQVTSIDSILNGNDISYIKFDVEGAEYEALIGGINTIKNFSPKMNIAVYHHCDDFFKLPLLVNSINSGYKFYLRQHPYIPAWDLNLYCVK